ncbi:MAG: glycosyltransferase [Acetobacter sp.]|nr:glycosyltransferase [Acetobacter sp.]
MDKTPLVSIVCITYNHERFIRDALDGFVMQKTNFPFEILVHDDASTDGTADVIREYEAKYPDLFRCVYQTENQWGKKDPCKDFLFPMVQGKYVALNEGDDYWTDENKLQKQVDFMESEKSRFYKTELILDDLLKRNFIQTNSVLYRWRFHQDPLSLMPDDILPGDWFLHLLHAQVGKIGFLNDVMSVYRRHRGGVWTEAEQTTQWYTRYGIPCVRFWQNMQKRFGIDCSSQINDMALLTELCLSKAGQIDALSELKNIYPDIPDFPRFIRLKILLYSLMIPFMFGEARKKIRRQKRFLKKFIKFGENSYGKQN